MSLTTIVRIEDANGDHIEVPMFQLLQWKHSLHLELKGLKNSRGSVYRHLLGKLNVAPAAYTLEQMSEYLDDCVRDISEQLGVTA
jgi:hypothetical protein